MASRHVLTMVFFLLGLLTAVPSAEAVTTYGTINIEGCRIAYTADCEPAPQRIKEMAEILQAEPGTDAPVETMGCLDQGVEVVSSIFSAVVCQTEKIMATAFSNMWCVISEAMKGPLAAVMVLYVAVLGVSFALGLTELSLGELGKQAIKLTLVWVFATQADYALGILFMFYMYVIKDGITIVLYGGDTSVTGSDVLFHIDELAGQIFETREVGIGDGSGGTNGVNRILTALAGVVLLMAPGGIPGGFILGPLLIAQGIMVFVVFLRTILTYLIAVIIVMFNLTLGPIFFCLALFQSTNQIFKKWFDQLASYSLQPAIIFAYLVFIEKYMPNFIDQIPLSEIVNQLNIEEGGQRTCFGSSLCLNLDRIGWESTASGCQGGSFTSADGADVREYTEGDFGRLIGSAGSLLVLNFATVKFLDLVPELARQLASSARAIRIGGGARDPSLTRGQGAVLTMAFDNAMQSGIDSMANANRTAYSRPGYQNPDDVSMNILTSGVRGGVSSVSRNLLYGSRP